MAKLSYTSVEDIFQQGLHEFTDQLQTEMNEVDSAIAETFFRRLNSDPVSAAVEISSRRYNVRHCCNQP